jgi:uncharacterized membrane protein
MANTIVGLFDERATAQAAVLDLINSRIARDKISIIATDDSGQVQTTVVDSHGNMATEGAAKGMTSGALVGGAAGLLIGAGFTVLPVAGLLLAGPIAGLLTGAVAGAAAGGILGGLIGLGIPEEHAHVYAEGVRRGGTLVTVQADPLEAERVQFILNRDGAVDMTQRGEFYRANGFTRFDPAAKPYTEAEVVAERARYPVVPVVDPARRVNLY